MHFILLLLSLVFLSCFVMVAIMSIIHEMITNWMNVLLYHYYSSQLQLSLPINNLSLMILSPSHHYYYHHHHNHEIFITAAASVTISAVVVSKFLTILKNHLPQLSHSPSNHDHPPNVTYHLWICSPFLLWKLYNSCSQGISLQPAVITTLVDWILTVQSNGHIINSSMLITQLERRPIQLHSSHSSRQRESSRMLRTANIPSFLVTVMYTNKHGACDNTPTLSHFTEWDGQFVPSMTKFGPFHYGSTITSIRHAHNGLRATNSTNIHSTPQID